MSVITEEQRTQFREEGYFILERVVFLAASPSSTPPPNAPPKSTAPDRTWKSASQKL